MKNVRIYVINIKKVINVKTFGIEKANLDNII